MNVFKMQSGADEAASFLRELANPRRLMILCALTGGPRTVSELMDETGLTQAAVSQQLARMRGRALVVAERRGRHMVYSLPGSQVGEIVAVLARHFCP